MINKFGLIIFAFWSVSCSSDDESSEPVLPALEVEYSKELLQQSWPVRLAKSENRASFEGSQGWIGYYNKDYATALSNLEGAGQARMHLELSGLYRQAALMHAYATEHIYGPPKNEIPLVEALYLRGSARSFLGRSEGARSDLKKFLKELPSDKEQNIASATRDRMKDQAEQLLQFDPSIANMPLKGFYFSDEIPQPGMTPKMDGPNHYLISDTADAKQGENVVPVQIEASEGMSLFLRAHWHEMASKQALGEKNQWLSDAWLLPWSTPLDTFSLDDQASELADLSDEWLFLSYYLVPEDILFLAELSALKEWRKSQEWTEKDLGYNQDKIKSHMEKWKERSLLASALAPALEMKSINLNEAENTTETRILLIPDILLELASKLKEDSLSEMKVNNPQGEPIFQTFSSFSEIALLRAGIIVAEVNGQYRDAGILRLNINDVAAGPTRDPLFHIAMGAWDVGNRYTMRAQDFIHSFSEVAPALETARLPLDQLHIRLGRETATSGPAH